MKSSKRILRIVLVIGAILILISRVKPEWGTPFLFIICGLVAVISPILTDKSDKGFFNSNKSAQKDNFIVNDDFDSGGN
jgi:hypothetical protein